MSLLTIRRHAMKWCSQATHETAVQQLLSADERHHINVIFFFSIPCLGHWWVYLPSKGQKLWHTGAFWEKRIECCRHSCSHGRNKGNAESVHLFCAGFGGGCGGGGGRACCFFYGHSLSWCFEHLFLKQRIQQIIVMFIYLCPWIRHVSLSRSHIALTLTLEPCFSRLRVKGFCQTGSGVSACRISLPTSQSPMTAAPRLRSLQQRSTGPDLWCAASQRATTRVRRHDFHTASCHLQ